MLGNTVILENYLIINEHTHTHTEKYTQKISKSPMRAFVFHQHFYSSWLTRPTTGSFYHCNHPSQGSLLEHCFGVALAFPIMILHCGEINSLTWINDLSKLCLSLVLTSLSASMLKKQWLVNFLKKKTLNFSTYFIPFKQLSCLKNNTIYFLSNYAFT